MTNIKVENRKLSLLASALLCWEIFVALPSYAVSPPGSPVCDPILMETFLADPISAVGHGVALNAAGEVVDITPEFIFETQRYYLKRLYQQANDELRSKSREKQQRLSEGKGCEDPDQININFALIALLVSMVQT